MVVASLCTALAWILLSKKLMLSHSPPVVTAYTILSGTAMLIILILGPQLANPFLIHKILPPPFAHRKRHSLDCNGQSAAWPARLPRLCSGTGAFITSPRRALASF